jgi:hypothetical protein
MGQTLPPKITGIPRRYGRKLGTASQIERATAAVFRKLERGELTAIAAQTLLTALDRLVKAKEIALTERLLNERDAAGRKV